MAVTTQTYSLPANWTVTQLWDAIEDAFVDAGYCAAQYDRFSTSGYEHLVIEIVHDAAALYGKRYYRLMFVSGILWASTANGWNATTHVPVGTAYVDHTNVSSTSTSNWWRLVSLPTTSSGYVKRYTSGTRSTFSAFSIVTGSANICFTVPGPNETRQPWVDLNKWSFGQLHVFNSRVSSGDGRGEIFLHMNVLMRRDINASMALPSGDSFYFNYLPNQSNYCYVFNGGQTFSGNNYLYGGQPSQDVTFDTQVVNIPAGITLPTAIPSQNPSFLSDRFPIFGGLAWSAYMADPLPADFGGFGSRSIAPSVGDDLIVTSGSEEWEVIHRRINPNWTDGTRNNVGWCARLV